MSNGKYARTRDGDGWIFVGDATKVLPAGIYKAQRSGGGGSELKTVDLKTDSPISIPGSVSEKVALELSAFWKIGDRFKNVGMLHKRGILLYGPPGAGKTSTAAAAARSVVAEDGIVLVLVEPDIYTLKMAIREIRSREAARPILNVVEDIDRLVDDGMEEDLLSLLDGEDQVDHIATLGTTNSLEKLGDRLVQRPSRFDMVLEVGLPSQLERHIYLKARLGDVKEALAWAKQTDGMSLAHLRELVVGVKCMGQSPEDVLKRLRTMTKKKIGVTTN